MHYVSASPSVAAKGTVLCVHGFPDSWYGYRHQINSITAAGFHVLVPDQRGYGETDVPSTIEDYRMELLCADMLSLMDVLGIQRVVLLGHDWGGTLIWNFVQQYPFRVSAIAAVCTPFFPTNPKDNPWVKMRANPGRFDYQLWFNTAEAQDELERDPRHTTLCAIRGTGERDSHAMLQHSDPELVARPPTEKGGWLVGLPAPGKLERSEILSEADLNYYTAQFARSGYFGPLSWYRNVERNWLWMRPLAGQKVKHQALMVTAGRDPVLKASMVKSLNMQTWVPRMVHKHVEEAGHWALQEQPQQVNEYICGWLKKLDLSDAATCIPASKM
eukprot:CAMPEP_0172927022 /NCGR_PEP_ID=MMETSP1075-20121228/216711_1 /TAXON_ID=2916 /ORGANISM="Ceratium fusus, Strain PA161109" /LENGTH=329 /DNA_ID=CAMNT_0013788203 /DNA_START=35 /DNA_END=1024 /DNA_ORIENTATION=-